MTHSTAHAPPPTAPPPPVPDDHADHVDAWTLTGADSGETGRFALRRLSRGGDWTFDFLTARFLGVGTSQRERHDNHYGTEYAVRGVKCNACRWFELRLFRVAENDYAIYTLGVSLVPGEVTLPNVIDAYSPGQLLEKLRLRGRDGVPAFTRPSHLALSLAADFDPAIAALYDPNL